ncbi:DUF1801 domain-containing protein [soil metagenome]
MKGNGASTVDEYLAALPADRRQTVQLLRDMVLRALPDGVEERMNWGMICYEIPLASYPDTYNGEPLLYAAIAAQKRHYALYLTCVYMDPTLEATLRDGFAAAGIRLDMGKSCIRFRNSEGIPPGVVEQIVGATTAARFIQMYEASRGV